MHIVITGGTGFIGAKLLPELMQAGHTLTVLTRQSLPGVTACRYINSLDEIAEDTTVDAIINLAGASLADRRWSEAYKREIEDSRLHTTESVVGLCRRLQRPPGVLLSASAIGYYGHNGAVELTEVSSSNPGFSSQLCQRWESAALEAEEFGVRVCLLRIGVVLDTGGGAFEALRQSFRFGVASWAGSGQQWFSWVHRQDVVAAIQFLLLQDELAGAFNITAPEAVTAGEFALRLAPYYRTILRVGMPAPMMRLLLGEMADELLLNGQRVMPARLKEAGFAFALPRLEAALSALQGAAKG
jgi:uncharacterized protein (TIGR01777 family)